MRLKIQSMKELNAEMLSVARRGRKAPANAGRVSFESVEAVMRLLTPENR
jgi:predicted transcriptional regulator